MSYRNLAEIAYHQGLYEKGIEFREKVLAIEREAKNRPAELNALLYLATDYRSLGRYDRALEVLQQALSLSREMKSRTSEAIAVTNIGIVYIVQGNHREAVGYLEQSLATFREAKMRYAEGRTLINLGECSLKLGRHQESIEFSNQALSVLREIKDREGEGITLGNLGGAYNASGQFEKAAESLSQALVIAREVKKPNRLREVLNELALLERNQGNLAKAIAYLEQSLKSLETSRSEIYNPQSRATFLAAEQESLRLFIDLLIRRHKAEPDQGLNGLAVEASERSRARVLLEMFGEARINIRQDVDAALVAQEQALGQKVNTWAQRLEQATKPDLVARLKLELSDLESEFERTQTAIRKASPQYAALTQPQPLKLREIQAQLDADTILLEYSLGQDRSYLWAITRDSLTSYELPRGEVIDKEARQLYEMLTARSTTKGGESALQRQQRIDRAEAALPVAAQQLSQTLLAPVAAHLANKRLVIVADGTLQYIPFAMLPHPALGKNQPLIVGHEVVSLPSASALAIQRAELAGRKPAPKLLAVIADPVFDRSDARLKTLATEASDKEQAQTIALDDGRSIEHLAEKSDYNPGGTTRRVIPRLPFTRQEATRLLALTPKQSSFGAIDFQASRETVLKGDLSQYRYVHFATHGLLDSERPGLSSLVLSMVDEQGKAQDGFLRANDIYNLKLPAELVVLSACQTGLGKEIKGEGLVGLTRGFMYAGAARVVVSLWNVNDKATAELMTKFYEKMLKKGERPAAALRGAQVEMWRQKQWQSPYYWAAFTMQGEWR
jgi:CHAT domain-containing protein/Tfp pilus assembly protein PilF